MLGVCLNPTHFKRESPDLNFPMANSIWHSKPASWTNSTRLTPSGATPPWFECLYTTLADNIADNNDIFIV